MRLEAGTHAGLISWLITATGELLSTRSKTVNCWIWRKREKFISRTHVVFREPTILICESEALYLTLNQHCLPRHAFLGGLLIYKKKKKTKKKQNALSSYLLIAETVNGQVKSNIVISMREEKRCNQRRRPFVAEYWNNQDPPKHLVSSGNRIMVHISEYKILSLLRHWILLHVYPLTFCIQGSIIIFDRLTPLVRNLKPNFTQSCSFWTWDLVRWGWQLNKRPLQAFRYLCLVFFKGKGLYVI